MGKITGPFGVVLEVSTGVSEGVSVGVAGRASGEVGTSLAWLAGPRVGEGLAIGIATAVGLAVASLGKATTGACGLTTAGDVVGGIKTSGMYATGVTVGELGDSAGEATTADGEGSGDGGGGGGVVEVGGAGTSSGALATGTA